MSIIINWSLPVNSLNNLLLLQLLLLSLLRILLLVQLLLPLQLLILLVLLPLLLLVLLLLLLLVLLLLHLLLIKNKRHTIIFVLLSHVSFSFFSVEWKYFWDTIPFLQQQLQILSIFALMTIYERMGFLFWQVNFVNIFVSMENLLWSYVIVIIDRSLIIFYLLYLPYSYERCDRWMVRYDR